MRASARVLGIALLFGLLSGCTNQTDGNPSASGGESESAPPGASDNVPSVAEPLNVAPYEKRPCALVEKDVIASLGNLGPGKADISSEDAKRLIGPNCDWSSRESVLSIGVVIDTIHRDHGSGGIKSVYAGKEQGLIEYVEEVTVPGHPGYPAAFSAAKDERDDGEYSLKVGVTDNLLIIVSSTNRDNPKKARPAALKVAASVLDTLKKGS